MSVVNKISSFLADQKQLIRDFYHLDYWNNHTLIEGFAEAAEEATWFVHEKTRESHRLVQASAGAGLGVAKLLGALPIGLLDWGMQVVDEVPKGPGQTLYKFLEVPIKGFYHGGVYVFETVRQWGGGNLNNKDSYTIANEVTATLGTAALLLFGSKRAIDGGSKFLSGAKAAATDLAFTLSPNGEAVATAMAGVGEVALAGGSDMLAGAVMMSAGEVRGETKGGEKTSPPSDRWNWRDIDPSQVLNRIRLGKEELKFTLQAWRIEALLKELEEGAKTAWNAAWGNRFREEAKIVKEFIDGHPKRNEKYMGKLRKKASAIARMPHKEVGGYFYVKNPGGPDLIVRSPFRIITKVGDLPLRPQRYVVQKDIRGIPRVRYGGMSHLEMFEYRQRDIFGAGWMRYDPSSRTLRISGDQSALFRTLTETLGRDWKFPKPDASYPAARVTEILGTKTTYLVEGSVHLVRRTLQDILGEDITIVIDENFPPRF